MGKWKVILTLVVVLGVTSSAQGQDTRLTIADMLTNGDMAEIAGRHDDALRWYHIAADHGDASAEVHIGEMYELAKGVPEDMAQAMVWFRKAADQGNAQGEFNVGLLYANGWGVKQDYGQALIWYRRAAEKGDVVAAESVGTIYQNGLGVSPDFGQARIWFDKAIAGGNTGAEIPLCGPYRTAWTHVAFGNDVNAMDSVIAKIDPYCTDLIKAAMTRRGDVGRMRPAIEKPDESKSGQP
jgi:TPR repeat protein